MNEFDRLNEMLSDAEIKAAVARAHQMRSEAFMQMIKSVVTFFTIGKRKPVVTETGVTCAI